MWIALVLLASHAAAAPATMAVGSKDPPVRVWLNSGGNYAYGDRAKVFARSARDAYLIVLRSDGAGRVRVLFPLDPQDDQRITGGKKYELKGSGGREAFVVDNTTGHGTVLAAISELPFRVDQFVQNGRWSIPAMSSPGLRDDAEAGLLELVERMKAPGPRPDYDAAGYDVPDRYAPELYPDPYPWLGWGGDPWPGYGRSDGGSLWVRSWDFHGHPLGWRRW